LGSKDLVYPLVVITSLITSISLLIILINHVYRKNGQSITSIMGLGFAVAIPAMWLHLTSGLESAVFGIGLATIAYLVIYFDSQSSTIMAIFVLALIVGLLRSDGFVYQFIILIASFITGTKSWKPLLLGLLLSVLVLFIWRYYSFGTFLPNTAIAKVNFGLLDRLPIGFIFLRTTLLNSGLLIFLFIGIAALLFEPRRIGLAGLFITIAWLGYYLYFGGDGYFERHLIGLYILLGAFSGPLWKSPKPITRIIFVVVIILIGFVSFRSYGNRFDYFSPKPKDPWISLGKALESDREKYGVLVIHAAGKVPYFGGGDSIDLLGLNDPYLATLTQDKFFPGHSAGNIEAAIDIAKKHPIGVYSTFSYLDSDFIEGPEEIALWVDNNSFHGRVKGEPTEEEWNEAGSAGTQLIWSIISQPSTIAE